MIRNRHVAIGLAPCLALFALLAAPSRPAHANTTFATQLHLSCDTCHMAGVDPKKTTLNAIGVRFLQCNYDAACAGLAGGQPQHATTKSTGGAARFINTKCGGAMRWVTLRHQQDGVEHNIAIAVQPGQTVSVALTQGTIFVDQCGQPADDGNWQYVVLD